MQFLLISVATSLTHHIHVCTGGIATGLTKAARQVEQADANNVQYLEAVEEAKILTLEQKYLC